MTPVEHVARELGQLVRSLKGLHAAVVEQAGVRLELPAAALLAALDERGRSRPSSLAEALHLDLSSVSRQVAALEREGWIVRERDPEDSRASLLELTPAGESVLARVRAARTSQLAALLPGWTADELSDFAASLHRFRTALSSGTPGTPGRPAAARPAPTTPDHDPIPALAGQETR